MAKKKTAEKAKIEAAPVLRAQGEDPTPETPVITKSYIMRDDWIDKGVVNTVAFKSVDGEVQDLLVNGEPAGGGGGEGVSYATMTISDPHRIGITIIGLMYNVEGELYVTRITTDDPEVANTKAVLGNGSTVLCTNGNVSASGNATVEPDGNDFNLIIITGNCAITVLES